MSLKTFVVIEGLKIQLKVLENRQKKISLDEMAISSPCDKCIHNKACADEKLACNEFTQFVETIPSCSKPKDLKLLAKELKRDGSNRIPNKEIYSQHFTD